MQSSEPCDSVLDVSSVLECSEVPVIREELIHGSQTGHNASATVELRSSGI